jgi:hypothetical protein
MVRGPERENAYPRGCLKLSREDPRQSIVVVEPHVDHIVGEYRIHRGRERGAACSLAILRWHNETTKRDVSVTSDRESAPVALVVPTLIVSRVESPVFLVTLTLRFRLNVRRQPS